MPVLMRMPVLMCMPPVLMCMPMPMPMAHVMRHLTVRRLKWVRERRPALLPGRHLLVREEA